MKSVSRLFSFGLAAVLVGSVASQAFAYPGEFRHNHPRRAEVLHRDNNLHQDLTQDRGHLGGHYNQLMHEDNHIRRQERADARADGGHITRGEQHQLNREENHLNRQIHRDDNQ